MKKSTFLLIFGMLAMFQSSAHVDLLNPLGGEIFNAGDTVNIQWQITVNHNIVNWDLFFSSDGGSTWDTIQVDISVGSLSYQWVVPTIATTQGQLKIVMDNLGSNYEGNCENFTVLTTTGIGTPFLESKIKVYPNPLTDFTALAFDNSGHESLTLILFDSKGRLVRTIANITANNVIIKRENLPSGLYFFQLRTNSAIRATGKLIIK
jgi:hypothetical protein